MYTCVNHVKFHDVLSHDWVMDECLQSCIHSIHICIYEWIVWNFTKCVTAWLINGWMPVIINAYGQIFGSSKLWQLCNMSVIMLNFTTRVTAWLSNGWMPVIINACGQIFGSSKWWQLCIYECDHAEFHNSCYRMIE